jgi:hypothetical protein
MIMFVFIETMCGMVSRRRNQLLLSSSAAVLVFISYRCRSLVLSFHSTPSGADFYLRPLQKTCLPSQMISQQLDFNITITDE